MDHPDVRADLGSFIGAVATAAARYPAFYAIDVWRNPGVSSDTAIDFCYCPHTEARFRDALQRRYGTLPALSAAWRRSLTAWSGVHVPHPGAAAVELSDWRHFVAVKLQEDLKFRSDASAPRGARPVTSHTDVARGAPDPWLMTSVVDHYGTSFTMPIGGPARVLAALDTLRSGGRGKSVVARLDIHRVACRQRQRNDHPAGGRCGCGHGQRSSRGAAALSVDPLASLVRDFGHRRAKPGIESVPWRRWPGSSVGTVPSCTAAPASFQDRDPVESDRNARVSHERLPGAVRHEHPG